MSYRIFKITFLALSIFLVTACTLAPQRNTLEEMSYRAAGYDGNQPRVLSDEPIKHFEQRVEGISGIRNASVILYGTDTMIIGIDTTGSTHPNIIENKVRQELQGETNNYLIYVVKDKEYPDLHAQVKQISDRLEYEQPVSEQELYDVVNETWKTVVPFNFGN
ncbi:hypothetical protein BEP19_10820 [Ammoniphilus oxalaticus]|uniref:Sporulation protein n=1 Tax=Ammoniphilus oxalaticus TaxID=66863 RepID=A0A419SG29_9BACL|nr:YhcN/YlaJ family sporulation lipoprotein [Ammoniphilus oxalaticus]RKD22736.1 hypothetical protein BEP19_10820 [Ammoniphilus oxalaticus]